MLQVEAGYNPAQPGDPNADNYWSEQTVCASYTSAGCVLQASSIVHLAANTCWHALPSWRTLTSSS